MPDDLDIDIARPLKRLDMLLNHLQQMRRKGTPARSQQEFDAYIAPIFSDMHALYQPHIDHADRPFFTAGIVAGLERSKDLLTCDTTFTVGQGILLSVETRYSDEQIPPSESAKGCTQGIALQRSQERYRLKEKPIYFLQKLLYSVTGDLQKI
jgi:hypothetical protein